jgi:formyl-CoA transferase
MERAEFFREARDDLTGPLQGLRVIDVTTVWSGPMAAGLLGDLGAEVIRVEIPGSRAGRVPPEIPGTGLSWFHETVNRNKRGLGLDLRVPAAREVLLRLVSRADVLVENFRPGKLSGWGVGWPDCRVVKPDLVYLSISGWGQYGPSAQRRGYDPLTQAFAGWMSLNGEAGGPPVKAPTFLADDLAGLHGALAALAALRHRDRTGEGQHVDVALLDSLLAGSGGMLTLGATGVPLRRWGDETEFLVPANVYACQDGHVYLVVALDKHWRLLAAAVGRPELARAAGFATNNERRSNREAVNAVLAGWCADRTVDEALAALEPSGVGIERVRTFAEAATDPHVRARGVLQDTTLSNGTVAPLTAPAAKFSRTPTRIRSGAPAAGADTEEILVALGFDDQERAALRAARAVSPDR